MAVFETDSVEFGMHSFRAVMTGQVYGDGVLVSNVGELGADSGRMQKPATRKVVAAKNAYVRKHKKLIRIARIMSSEIMDAPSRGNAMELDVRGGV